MRKLILFVLCTMCIILSTSISRAQQRTYFYTCSKQYDKNGVQSSGKYVVDRYYTFTDNVAYVSDANGNSKGGSVYKYRGRTDDGNLWYCNSMDQPNVSYVPGVGISSYNTTRWTPDLGELIVAPDYSVLNDRIVGVTSVMVRTSPSSSSQRQSNGPKLRR